MVKPSCVVFCLYYAQRTELKALVGHSQENVFAVLNLNGNYSPVIGYQQNEHLGTAR